MYLPLWSWFLEVYLRSSWKLYLYTVVATWFLEKTLLYEASVRLVLGGVRRGHQVPVWVQWVPSVVVHGSWNCARSYDL